jgi:hypothetical protein
MMVRSPGPRCRSEYPGSATLHGKPIRCERARGHEGSHGHSFAARYWDHGSHRGRDWAGRLMACALGDAHSGACRGSHGGTLRR